VDTTRRKFPYPFKAMLAVSTDIDFTTPNIFRQTHRFMNTREETKMGRGVGLDVANSCWLYNPRERPELRYFRHVDWHDPAPEAEELASYICCGWVDTLHTYGNFTGALYGRERFSRQHAVEALKVLADLGVELKVWVNHGGAGNIQNFGRADYMEGDRPGSAAYHTDLLLEHGLLFAWNHDDNVTFGHDSMLSPLELEDGRRVWGFPRAFQELDPPEEALETAARVFSASGERPGGTKWLFSWYPDLLPWQLAPAKLETLVEHGQYAVVAQHLGALAGPQGYGTTYSDPAVDAFRTLADFRDRGLVLVSATSRLLEYNRVSEHLVYRSFESADRETIRIDKVADPVFGDFVPTVQQLRGVTFAVADRERVELTVGDEPVPDELVVRVRDEKEGDLVGIAWHEPDATDYTEPWAERRRVKAEPLAVGPGAEEGGPRPIFVAGAAGSGTTLATNLIGSHSQIEPVYDTDFVVPLLRLLASFDFWGEEERERQLRSLRKEVAEWVSAKRKREAAGQGMPELPFGPVHVGFSAEKLDTETARLVERLYEARTADERFASARAYVDALFGGQADDAGKRTWVNKSPEYIGHLAHLELMHPRAVLVHVVRDGRDVSASLLRRRRADTPLYAALRWLRQVEAGLLYEQQSPDRVIRISFEELVAEPAAALAPIFAAAGVSDEGGRIADEVARRGLLLPERRFAWRTDVAPVPAPRGDRIAAFEAIAPTLRLLGYDIGERDDVRPAAVDARRLADIRAAEQLAEGKDSADVTEAAAAGRSPREVQVLRAKAAKLEVLKQELAEVEKAAADYDAAVKRLPELRAKRNKLPRILEEIEALEETAAEYEAAVKRLPELRAKARGSAQKPN
jgi:sulfotransferase family protein